MNSIIMNFDDSVDINVAFAQLRALYPKARMARTDIDLEAAEDEYLLALAEQRLENDTGERISHEEMWESLGVTQEELDEMEDVELEYELPNRVFPRS
ncbi:MAG: hypothetical protein FWD23_15145 [Oscillospiraceae bacterium]|nr:hypothetical protein [Oscillospiraceae bacterium]